MTACVLLEHLNRNQVSIMLESEGEREREREGGLDGKAVLYVDSNTGKINFVINWQLCLLNLVSKQPNCLG